MALGISATLFYPELRQSIKQSPLAYLRAFLVFRVYQKVPLSLRERVGVRATERRNQLRKPAAIRATLTPDPSPTERLRGDYGIGSLSSRQVF